MESTSISSPSVPNFLSQLHTEARVIGVVVGIETYEDKNGKQIPDVEFAKNDANGFVSHIRKIFTQHDIDLKVLINSSATRSNIENELKASIYSLSEKDLFVFYYAGHGFHDGTSNMLTAWDSHSNSFESTTISMRHHILDALAKSHCKRSLVFMDTCAKPLKKIVKSRDIISELSSNELQDFLNLDGYSAVFLSCEPGQKSYPSKSLKHGIWTYHLLQALSGLEAKALGPDNFMTDTSLRDYLSQSVPRYITKHMTISGSQKPIAMIAAKNTFALCQVIQPKITIPPERDFSSIEFKPDATYFASVEERSYEHLPGFKKSRGHFVPDTVNEDSAAFAASLLSQEIREEIDEIYKKTKKHLKLRRKEIEIFDESIDTSYYRYWIEVRQNPRDSSEIQIIRGLTVRSGSEDLLENVDVIFGDIFDRYVCELTRTRPDFDIIVNVLEEMEIAYGGELDDNELDKLAIYEDHKGVKFVFDLLDGRVSIIAGKYKSFLDVLDVVREIQIGSNEVPVAYLR